MKKLLKYNFPEIYKELDFERNTREFPNINLENISYGSGIKLYWICPDCKNSYYTSVHSRTNMGSKCPYCSDPPKKLLKGFNDLESWCVKNNRQDILDDWNYEKNKINPDEVFSHSNSQYYFKCKHGHEWRTSLCNKVRKNNRCPFCSNNSFKKGYNDFKTFCKENNLEYLLDEWDYDKNTKNPEDIFINNRDKYYWKCSKCSNSWTATTSQRINNNTFCPFCNHQKSSPELTITEILKENTNYSIISGSRIGRFEMDIYVSELQEVLEYDGEHWHNSEESKVRELRKNIYLFFFF